MKKYFKRFLSLLIAVVMILCITGCSNNDIQQETNEEGKVSIFKPGTYEGTGDGNGGKFS